VVDQRVFGAVRIASVFREDFVRSVGRTVGRAVEVRVVVVRMADVDAVVAAAQAVVDGRTVTSAALAGAPRTLVPLLVGVVILRALVLALLASFVLDTLLADLFVKSVGSALLAARMALAADGFAGQWLERTLLLRTDPFVVIAVRTRLRLLQASLLYRAIRSNVSPFLSLKC